MRQPNRITMLVLALSATGTLPAQSPIDLVRRGIDAMGGEAALRGVRSASYTYQQVSFGLGQGTGAELPDPAMIGRGEVLHDHVAARRRLVEERQPAPGFTMQVTTVLAGNVLHATANNGLAVRTDAAGVAEANRQLRLSPERILVTALDHPSALSSLPPGEIRGVAVDGVRLATDRDTLALWFDRLGGRLLATETRHDDAVLGDRIVCTVYSRWSDAGDGVQLPRQVDRYAGERHLSQVAYGRVRVNAPLADSLFAIPESARAAAVTASAAGPVAERVTLDSLAPGVWHVTGGSHHSLLVAFGGGLLLVDAPLSAARTLAIREAVAAKFAGQEINAVVMSHHHWDHSGGVREAMASGASVFAHERNAAFVTGIARAPKTVAPDALSRGAPLPPIHAIGDAVTMAGRDGSRLELHRLPNDHAEGMLAAYHPASRILFVVDVLSPEPTMPRTGADEVVALVERAGLSVDRVAGGHGGVVPWSAVEQAARQ